MISTDVLFRIGDAAEAAGDHAAARQAFERGAALGDVICLERLALTFDVGIGVEVDKALAMRCYQRAWRRARSRVAANNIAILYREVGDHRAMFAWFKCAADQGDADALVDLAFCRLNGARRPPVDRRGRAGSFGGPGSPRPDGIDAREGASAAGGAAAPTGRSLQRLTLTPGRAVHHLFAAVREVRPWNVRC
jgi:TPR repeat protein